MTERGVDGRSPTRIGRLVSACVRRTGVDGGGVAVLSSQRMPVLLHASDEVARAVGDLQFTMGAGPSVDAVTTGSPVLVGDTRAASEQADRWPALFAELVALDVGALFAFPIRVGAVALGTLDLYRRTPGDLSTGQLSIGATTGAAVAESLLAPDPHAGPDWTYPMTVHRAAGMVMVQIGTSIDDALVRLRATAYEEGLDVTVIATEVLDRTRTYAPEPS